VLYKAPSINVASAVNNDIVPLSDNNNEITLATEGSDSLPESVENNLLGSQSDACNVISAEIDMLNTGLGSAAVEEPPNTAWPSVAQRVGGFMYNLATQTVLGALQPVIQTKRALFNDDEKDKRMLESVERGNTRRAYLIGYAQASGCDQNVEASASSAN
jgi:hypothetical protein